ncbi:MAG: hypothetical protein SGI98_06790 [Verrucomicrobiota bacterium]|nr:hypothetical protein [Verrucomicrobiota bacterium]
MRLINRNFLVAGVIACAALTLSSVTHAQMPPVNAPAVDPVDNLLKTPEMRVELTTQYEKNPQSFTGSKLLATAISYASQKKLPESRDTFLKYLEKNTDNPRAYRGLGNVYLMMGSTSEAIGYYKLGWKLKDADSLAALSVALLSTQRLDELDAIQSDMLANKTKNIEVVNVLMANAIENKNDKDLFNQAIAGITGDQILSREDTSLFMLKGFYKFNMAKEAKQLEAKCQAKGYDITKAQSKQ